MIRYSALTLMVLALSATSPALMADGDPVNNSRIAFTLPEKDLLPENIAYDPKRESFFVGSTRKGKILRIDKQGKVSDFVAPRAHGLWMVIGMKVDAKRDVLWVNSSYGSNLENRETVDGRPAGLFRFNLEDGALLGSYILNDPGTVHFLNDLVIRDNGDVYVTHGFDASQIYRFEQATQTFAPFLNGDKDFSFPNGITLSPDQGYLYVAHNQGVSRIHIQSKERKLVKNIPALQGIDGLYWYQQQLVAFHSWDHRLVRYFMDDAGLESTGSETLEAHHPLFNNPSTGVVVGNQLYYIANAQFDSFTEDGELFPPHRLYEPVILKADL